MLWKCCTQYASKFGKLSSGHRTGKGQFSFQSQRKAMPKNAQTTALISHTSKVMLKILQARLQQCMNHELPNVQAGFRKGRGTRDQIANNRWIGPHWGRSLTVAQLFICTFISQGFKLLENRKHVFSSSCLQGLDQCLPRREPFMNIYQGTEQSMWSLEFIGDPSYLC